MNKGLIRSTFPPRIVVCVGAVVKHQQRVLFVRQASGDLRGKWSLPWGYVDGITETGAPEPPDVAAAREVYEEAGVRAEIEGRLGMQNHASSDGELRLYLLFLCHHLSGEPKPDFTETDGAAYFSLDELESIDEPVDEFCAWLARRVVCGTYQVIPPTLDNPYHPYQAFL